MKQAIGYLRQSTTKQQSLSAQKQTIKALAEKHNIPHITFIAINNQDVLINGMAINKLLN